LTNSLGGSDDLISQSFRHGLVGSESCFSGSLADQVDSLVDSSEWGDIDGLSSDGTTGTDSGGVFSGSTLNESLEKDLKWVLSGEEVDDLKTLSEDSYANLLFTVLSMHTNHEGVDESLGNWALDLLEAFFLIFTSSVWDKHLSFSALN
jgi:hypothetical protein